MAFLVLAFPTLDRKDLDWIQSHRKTNDNLFYKIVDPHFTLVFPVYDKTETEFIKEVTARSKGIKKINFELRSAAGNKDELSEYYHEFLVPEKGYSDIVKLHDQLYSGELLSNLNSEIDFIPHITIGTSNEEHKCNVNVGKLNSENISIGGTIEQLTVVKYENNVVTKIIEVALG